MANRFSALLDDLASARWDVAARTFGSDHATLVGLLVEWWVSGAPEDRWALESGPSYGYVEGGAGRGQCDALLCEGRRALGLVEVEGYRRVYTAEKIGKFLGSSDRDLASLAFAILLVYAYAPEGRGEDRVFPVAADEATLEAVSDVSKTFPDRPIAVIAIDKSYERDASGIRARNEYYRGTPSAIRGRLYLAGHKKGDRKYFQRVG